MDPEESNADPGGHRGEGSKIEGLKNWITAPQL